MLSPSDSHQIRFFLCAASACGIVLMLIAYLCRGLLPGIEFEGLTLGVIFGLINLFSLWLVVATLLGIMANQALGVVILLIKGPVILFCVWWVAQQSTAFIYSALLGALLFIPAGFLTAFFAPSEDNSSDADKQS